MESLTKENFWNDLHDRYPGAVDHFCKWIDQYKEEVGWKHLFHERYFNGTDFFNNPDEIIKFHHIPFDMQVGIIIRYIEETEGDFKERPVYMQKLRDTITEFFKDRHEHHPTTVSN